MSRRLGRREKRVRGERPFILVLFVVTLLLLANSMAVRSQENVEANGVNDLWIDMLMGPPLVQPFNDVSRVDDLAHVDRPEQLGQLDGITIAQKMLIFKSAGEAEQQLPGLASQIDVLGYNLEHGPGTPPEEKDDPTAAIKKMRALADEYELALALGPDHDFALSHGAAMAPYVDYFILQVQRKQTEPPVVIDFVSTLVPQLRAANDDLRVSVQVRTEGDMEAILQLLESLLPYIDGVSILTSPQTVEEAEELLQLLRGGRDITFSAFIPMITADNK